MEQAILQALASAPVPLLRPNKLRKIVLRQHAGTWTEFQTALDALMDRLETQKNEQGELVIRTKFNAAPAKEEEIDVLKVEMELPKPVVQHLTRKGRRKQKNIEQTTKVTIQGLENQSSSTITIVKTVHDKSDESKAQHQLQAAVRLITNMVEGYRQHPERFETKRGGGTLEEQALAKQIRQEFSKKRGIKAVEERKKKKKRKFY